MQSSLYAHLAAEFAESPLSIAVTDEQFNALYFNPAAGKNIVVKMTERFVRDSFDSQQLYHLENALQQTDTYSFHANLGDVIPHRYSVQCDRIPEGLVFTLQPDPDEAERRRLRQQNFAFSGYRKMLSSPLHGLLALSEQAEIVGATDMAAPLKKQVYSALQTAREMDFAVAAPVCAAFDSNAYLRAITDSLAPFLFDKFGRTLHFSPGNVTHSVKCDARQMRAALYRLICYAMHAFTGDLYWRSAETGDRMFIIIENETARHTRQIFVPVETPGTTHDHDFAVASSALAQQQAAPHVQCSADGGFRIMTALQTADTEISVRETVGLHLEEMLDINEIDFANFIP